MNKEILYEILTSDSDRLSSAEIESIMNEELDKSPEEMDTDLVDLCLEALTSADDRQLNMKKHRIRFTKVLVAAVIFVLIVSVSIPVGAKYFNVDVPEGIVTFYKDYFSINLLGDKYIRDISGQLATDGIENAVLPDIVFKNDTLVYDYCFEENYGINSISFWFENDNIKSYVLIENHISNIDNTIKLEKAPKENDNIRYITVNGIGVIIFSDDENSHIQYISDNVLYDISLSCDFETACQIAETI